MTTTAVIFVSVSILQAVIFTFTLLLIKQQKPIEKGVSNYNVDAATKLAELEGAILSLRQGFAEVIDRLERWTKRDTQREKRPKKNVLDDLPTDADLPTSVTAPDQTNAKPMTVFDRLRAAKGA